MYATIRKKLLASTRPLFLFDDDPDGLASFLLLYRLVRCGKGMPLKGKKLNKEFSDTVNDYQPDLIIILDIHSVEDNFFKGVHSPIIWLDHHKIQQPPRSVLYVNPRKEEQNLPTSHLAYKIAQQDEWLAVTGIISDWELPEEQLRKHINEKYPTFLPKTITRAPEGLYKTDAGKMARIFSFLLKGRIKYVLQAMKMLTRVENPYDILEQRNAQTKLLYTMFSKKESEYLQLLESVHIKDDEPLILFEYDENTTSYTTDLSNELLQKHPEKVILIARQSNRSYKCSLRASNIRIDILLEEILEHVKGSGGGHEHACGADVANEDFEHFVELLKAKIE